ncbi:hypothetical protein [Streptococcus salivarius]|uniref:hypothetical protein n=1 Tax=Streptococcus salivarius TaxID=1304 RepID=UPI00093B4A3D|nr:hypothetical protein [Streptococcus salivarius]
MAGKNKKNELDFIKEIEAYEQQRKEAIEQLKAYQKSQTDKLGQVYFELKKLENPDLSIDDLVVETQNKVKEVKKEIKSKKAAEKARKDAEETNKETYNDTQN